MPRVGILVECGPDGLEVHVCRKICALLQRETGIEIEPTIIPMGNKLALIEDCGTRDPGPLQPGLRAGRDPLG